MNSELAPVALFAFNRPQLTSRVYDRIRAAKPRRLLVVADGPRPERPGEARLCEETRKLVSSPDWPCELLTNFADENLGCRCRVSSGLDWVFDQCSEAIILEDDCLPDVSFFTFCQSMLEHHREDPRVMHVSGDNFQDGHLRGSGSYYFSRYTVSWGWATWRRAWQHYDVGLSLWPQAKRERWLTAILDDPPEVEYWTVIFDKLYDGGIDTWDYQWLFSCWRNHGLSIIPNVNLVSNIGAGADATHFKSTHSTIGIPAREIGAVVHPAAMIRDKEADRYTFENHIVVKPVREKKQWLRKARKRLALGTRMKSLLRPRLG